MSSVLSLEGEEKYFSPSPSEFLAETFAIKDRPRREKQTFTNTHIACTGRRDMGRMSSSPRLHRTQG